MALRADLQRIVRWVLARGLALTAVGVTAGLIVYALAVPYLRASLTGIATWDPLPLVAATVQLVCTAALGCWLPARRAAAIEPA